MNANTWLIAAVVLVIGFPVSAENDQSWQGYLVDRSCRASTEGDSNTLNFVKAQTRDCALMPACRKAGYAIFTKGTWFNLDSKGNVLAVKYLQNTQQGSAFYVSLKGKLKDQVIRTKSITKLAEPVDARSESQEQSCNARN